jgi:hypothetical protein
MRIKQYAYLGLTSEVLTPPEITARVGMEPDEERPKASRRRLPPVPRVHLWKVRAAVAEPSRIDVLLEALVDRLDGHAEAIGRLVANGEARATIHVVRYLDADDGEAEVHADADGLVTLAGQHQLLGFHLGARVLDFARRAGAHLDFDEYG